MLVRHCDICGKPLKDDAVRFDITIDKFNSSDSNSSNSTSHLYPMRFDLCKSCCEQILLLFTNNKNN